ncbi:putative cyclin-D6-1 [Vigna umbellata]|uniref:putative cyclin-D6-1 n=1 Tax=Vigna umbellata TaxID=87088 RepID=UPI001F5F958A|nr:putative cyclin-D6-1 [Vigna umbellata]
MDFDTEFSMLSKRDLETISDYFKIEHEFMAPRSFYSLSSNARHRMHAVSMIAKFATTEPMDSYIPYVAVNYFDRFISTNSLTELQGSSLLDKVRLVAICCYTLSAKMRTKNFPQKQFLTRKEAVYKTEVVMRIEFRILSGLDWRMRSITPFHFLDYYYPPFKRIGGFKRQCINEIIVQSQGEVYFAQFKPSEIAMSALLAATYLGYSSKFTLIEGSIRLSDDLMACYQEMVQLCRHRKINISKSSGEVIFPVPSSSTTESEEGLGKAAELRVRKQRRSSRIQVLNTVLENDEEEEEEDVALLNRRNRNRNEEAGEASKEVEEGKSEAEKLREVMESAARVASGTGARQEKGEGKSEEMVEAESGTRDDESKGPCEEIVGAESSRAREDKGKGKAVEEASENELRKRQIKGKGKAVDEMCETILRSETGVEGAPLRAMNFQVQWPVIVRQGERVDNIEASLYVDESRITTTRCPRTIRGSDIVPPPLSHRCQCKIM